MGRFGQGRGWFVIQALLAVILLAMILAFSSMPDLPSMTVAPFDSLRSSTLVQKGGHFAGYGLLGVFIFGLLPRHLSLRWRVAITLMLILTVGALDEMHQVSVPGRHARITDVMIDTSGAAAALGIRIFGANRLERIRT